MPCIFCVAVLMMIAGVLTATHVDEIEEKLRSKAEDTEVRRTVDSESVAKFELAVAVDSVSVPVAVTVFKDHKRVRIQVLTHELSPQEVEQLEEELAQALDAEVVDRSDPAHEAHHDHEAEDTVARRERVSGGRPPERERVSGREPRPSRP